jgi:hypothetical protein
MSNKLKKKARLVQDVTGMPYQTCLKLVTGELQLRPQHAGCAVAGALREIFGERYEVPSADAKPCLCEVCDP